MTESTPVDSGWVRVRGRLMHARRIGSGAPAAVCVHGAGVSSRYMTRLLGEMARVGVGGVQAVDLPGHGLSSAWDRPLAVPAMAEALMDWMQATQVGPTALIANSAGCQVAVDAAARWPQHITHLVLIGPTVDPAARTVPRVVARWLRNAVHESARQLPGLLLDFRDLGPAGLLADVRSAVRDRIEDKLPLVQVPALVVRGSRDRLAPEVWAEQVAALLPQGRLLVVPGAAHVVNFTHPQLLAEVVRNFLVRRPSSAA